MLAWMIYIMPMAPPALFQTHSFVLVLRAMVVLGYVAVKLATIWFIIPSVLFGEAAMAACESSCKLAGSKTYQRSLKVVRMISKTAVDVAHLDCVKEPARSNEQHNTNHPL